jgi:galactokinase/galacturonokinase
VGVLMAFCPRDDGLVVARSRQFENPVSIAIADCSPAPVGDWADYLRGAVLAAGSRFPLRRGMSAVVDGRENAGGLSSSAAVGVAYLLALEAVNDSLLGPAENVELDRLIENGYIGLSNGILDQSVILRGERERLACLDCESGANRSVPFGGARAPAVVVLFSGLRSRLCETDYNARVGECRRAAADLLRAARLPVPSEPGLRSVPRDVYDTHRMSLRSVLRRRADHFFGEQERVRRGVEMWEAGDLIGFGRLVTDSGWSSVRNYECGNEYLRSAFEVLTACEGAYGARFSGAGFRGCCIGLAEGERADGIAREALAAYIAKHPDMAGAAEAYCCSSADGACILSVGDWA